MPLPLPDEADRNSAILAQETEIAGEAYSLIEQAVAARYTRGEALHIPLPNAVPTERCKKMIREKCGVAWDVKFDSNTQYNDTDYFIVLRAADEVSTAESYYSK